MKLLATLTDSLDPGSAASLPSTSRARPRRSCWSGCRRTSFAPPARDFLGLAWLGAPGKSDLVACAHAGLCRIDPTTWTVNGVLHQPCMNDLHHVAVHDGRLLVVNTGLDRIDVFETSGQFMGGWDLSPAWIAAQRLGRPQSLTDQLGSRPCGAAGSLSRAYSTMRHLPPISKMLLTLASVPDAQDQAFRSPESHYDAGRAAAGELAFSTVRSRILRIGRSRFPRRPVIRMMARSMATASGLPARPD